MQRDKLYTCWYWTCCVWLVVALGAAFCMDDEPQLGVKRPIGLAIGIGAVVLGIGSLLTLSRQVEESEAWSERLSMKLPRFAVRCLELDRPYPRRRMWWAFLTKGALLLLLGIVIAIGCLFGS
jgi:hypothetical protein